MAPRDWRAARRYEPCCDAANCRFRERVVRVPDGLPGLPPSQPWRRLMLALTGAGLALTAAVAFATFVKLMGLGVLSRSPKQPARIQLGYSASVGLLGLFVLALGVGMPWWLQALDQAATAQFGVATASQMHDGLLLVPLTAKFAFTSPSLAHRRDAAPGAASDHLDRRKISPRDPPDSRMVRRPLSGSGACLDDGVDVLQRDANVLQFCLSADSRHRARRGCRRIFCEQAGVRA